MTSNRRDFLKLFGGGVVAAVALTSMPLSAISQILPGVSQDNQQITSDDNLWDIKIGRYDSAKKANNRLVKLRSQVARELKSYFAIKEDENGADLYLNVNTIREFGDNIIRDLKANTKLRKGETPELVENLKLLGKSDDYSVLELTARENPEAHLVAKYLKASNDESIRELVNLVKKENDNQYVEIPTNWLKSHVLLGYEEGKEIQILNADNTSVTLRNKILNNMLIPSDKALDEIVSLNDLNKEDLDKISTEVTVAIPSTNFLNRDETLSINDLVEDRELNPDLVKIPTGLESRTYFYNSTINNAPTGFHNYKEDTISRNDLKIIRDAKIPTVLVEAFHLSNNAELGKYLNENNLTPDKSELKKLTDKFVEGIDSYYAAKLITSPKQKENCMVFLTVGHGEHGPGAVIDVNGVEVKENMFNKEMTNLMKEELLAKGYQVEVLNFQGKGKDLASRRLDHYITEINKGNPDFDIAVSMHAESKVTKTGRKWKTPSGTFVIAPTNKKQNYEAHALGRNILRHVRGTTTQMSSNERTAYIHLNRAIEDTKLSKLWEPIAMSLMQNESSHRHYSKPNTVVKSSSGHMGYMQISNTLAKDMGYKAQEAYNPEENIEIGITYLSKIFTDFRKRGKDQNEALRFALTSYNLGPNATKAIVDHFEIETHDEFIGKLEESKIKNKALSFKYPSGRLGSVSTSKMNETIPYANSILLNTNEFKDKISAYKADFKR